ncbi:G-type lectin S-receptor-like serine/threonine-protein kinase CES101 [Cornus florida]|uniref:G-type lectin S-receptor-like serine/threonine-protein kinase CES101 n=1 Tax=Cornus florida TaxID=4283 RepID=UPI002897D9F1|nr:G-type lectin S-receptor-like serine/threonine-protein kinase CES101 [Cornus florida]
MDSNKRYLGIWYTDIPFQPMWVANRNTPLYDNSGVLFIDKAGKLIVTNNAGDPIRLYESESDNINITATLLDSGNFVVSEENSYGSTKQPFWESFDYPTDTLLPGMKLGVNHRTGKNWTLTSWFAENELASGPFSLEWDPRGHRLVVRRRGVIYWTSGVSKDKAFEFMPKTDPMNIKYDFTSVTNEEEEYFTYSLVKDHEFMPGGRRVKSGWVLDYQGRIYDQDMTSIAQVNLCYGYNTKISKVNGGCELWEQPKCRNRHQKFNARSGYFGDTGKASHVDDNQSLSLSDCRDICWNDCDCIGFRSSGFSSSGTGCIFWRGNLEFHQDYSGVTIVHYVLISEALNN